MSPASFKVAFPARGARQSESGYILLGVLILVALFVIALAVAAPIVAKDIERDKEVEAVQRGQAVHARYQALLQALRVIPHVHQVA